MKAPSEQWAIQIDVTNACRLRCSNCTRLTVHVDKPFFMSVDQFTEALESVVTFPHDSIPDVQGRRKVIGMIGGEPLLHPDFVKLCEAMERIIPKRENRGIWTSMGPHYGQHEKLIKRVFGYLHNHPHTTPCRHQPVLVASKDAIPDRKTRLDYIWNCWLQNSWCGSITPKGVFFCEVAGTLDMIFRGPGGLPIEPMWWNRSLLAFHDQVELWCHRCGVCLPLPGRLDCDEKDDVSMTNLKALSELGSKALDRCELFACSSYQPKEYAAGWSPREYRDLSKGKVAQ